ncbi:MAG: malate dehydrogenase [Bacteroidota bacterium]
MTYHAIKLSGFDPNRVFGSGTLLDSARFRTLLSQKMGIHPDDLRAYILGEHGDSQFPLFSMAMTGGSKISENQLSEEIYQKTKKAGHEVMNKKGHTNYAISMSAALIIETIAWDSNRTIPVSQMVNGYLGEQDVCLSLPAVIGSNGISMVIEPVLKDNEIEAFHACAEIVRVGIALSKSS